MKKILFLFTLLCVFNSSSFSQNIPQGINYQAMVRDANGNAKTNEQVPVQFTIYQSSATGTMIYKEQQLLTTNNYGQFNAIIGQGNPVTPFTSTSFENIDWALDSTFIKVELNANTSFTGVFTQIGTTTKFQSVPYALSAKTKAPTMQVFLSGSGTYTTPAGVKYIKIRMVGGGAGGSNSNSTSGAGGGAGGYIEATIVAPSANYNYSVGSGGTTGNNGGNTVFGLNIANGGVTPFSNNTGGVGGTATLITGFGIALSGGGGGGGMNTGAGGSVGFGGNSALGGGGAANGGTGGTGYSGASNTGGGGAGGGAPNGLGGSGGSGIIIIEEYFQ